MNSMINAAATAPSEVQQASLTVYQLTVAGLLAAAIIGIIIGLMTYMANHHRDIVKGEVKPLVARLVSVDDRLNKIDTRLDRMDTRLDKMDTRLDKMDDRFDRMDERMNSMEVKIDKVAGDVSLLVQVVSRLADHRARAR
jgi:flagellar capping protein FliD